MSGLLERIKEVTVVRKAISIGGTVYAWTSEQLWPLYSTGMVLSAVFLIANIQEKQTLADHLYGGNKTVRGEDGQEVVQKASKRLEDDIALGIKHDVWTMPAAEFKDEYRQRYGDSISYSRN